MTMRDRILPHPVMTAAVLALWLVLAPSMTLGQIVLGLALGIAIPRLTRDFWPERPRLRRPWSAVRLVVIVLFDIVVANWAVARLVIGPLDRLRPPFVEVPLDLRDGFAATILGSIVSLTPGTVSVEVDRERWVLLVHGLDVEDAPSLAANIKARYEAPLREILEC